MKLFALLGLCATSVLAQPDMDYLLALRTSTGPQYSLPDSPDVWLSGSTLSNTANGTAISTGASGWADSSGNNHPLEQGSAAARPYVTNGNVSTVKAVYFDGSAYWAACSNTIMRSNFTVLAVVLQPSSSAWYIEVGPDPNSSPGMYWWGGENYSYFVKGGNNNVLSGNSTAWLNLGAWYVVALRVNATESYVWMRKNGYHPPLTVTSTQAVAGDVTNHTYFCLRSKLKYLMAEMVWYNRTLTSNELVQAESYLYNKHGITP